MKVYVIHYDYITNITDITFTIGVASSLEKAREALRLYSEQIKRFLEKRGEKYKLLDVPEVIQYTITERSTFQNPLYPPPVYESFRLSYITFDIDRQDFILFPDLISFDCRDSNNDSNEESNKGKDGTDE